MIDTKFELSIPNQNWKTILEKSGDTPFPNKFWELSIHRDNVILGYSFLISTQTDHAGLFITFTLFRFTFDFQVYDNRHWDDESNSWESE